MTWLSGVALLVFAALLCAALIAVLRPLLVRYAPARPNARSSHTTPTPQGGGIAVIASTIAAVCLARYFSAAADLASPLVSLFAATILIACVGAADDIRSVPVAPRLLLQTLAVGLVIYTLPDEVRALPSVPWWIERALLVVGGVYFVNLVNFMDGLDWMTVAEIVPLTATLSVMGAVGAVPSAATIVALALCGAMIGFAYFNRPVATLFLGDVGSLSIGLLLGWLLLLLATRGHLAAAVVLPLYYLADATITLFRRLVRGEPVWRAHRTHFYQRATDGGFTVAAIVGRVFLVNVGLCALALLTVIVPGRPSTIVALAGGGALVTLVLVSFAGGKNKQQV
jgi:UDP-N-acetylmuramyl pentapeptide phosphotransferase/UDP-N-acetylglucosamine-1-phosphate transferase